MYDYNLPDRGLGSQGFPGMTAAARFPAVPVGYLASLGVPVSAWNQAAAAVATGNTVKKIVFRPIFFVHRCISLW